MTRAIAWLGMYDHPAQHRANDRLWQAIVQVLRGAGVREVPDHLARDLEPQAAWSHGQLLLGQICTRPLRELHQGLRVIGHPVYADTDRAGWHRAHIVTRADSAIQTLDDTRIARAAINDRGSNTGLTLLEAVAGPIGSWASVVIETGSHRASVAAVGRGEADIAAVDEITLRAIGRYEPRLLSAIRVIGMTPEAPTPPFVTAPGTSPDTIEALEMALRYAATAPELGDVRRVLGLERIAALPAVTHQTSTSPIVSSAA